MRSAEICRVVLSLMVLALTFARTDAAEPGRSLQDLDKHLVLDDRVILRTERLKLVQGKVAKHPNNPLFQADQPWENSLNNLYPNIDYDASEGRFKLWYKCVLHDPDVIAKLDPPRTVHDQGWLLLYAVSRDGLKWDKPALGLHPFAGSTANNAVARDTPNVGVFRDSNPHSPADRRFKMIYDVGLGNMRVRFSPDGLNWTEPIEAEGLGARVGDTHNNAFWDERLQKYVLISRLVLGERLVGRAESEDFVHWRPATVVLRSTLAEGRVRQTYCMPSFAYGGGYLGFAMMYQAGGDKSVDCELVWSPDTWTWHRPFAGTPFIPRGKKGEYDAECIYAQANPPIVRDGRLMIFYGGDDYPHIGWKRHCLPCLAELRMDGFAAYEHRGEQPPGVLETQPLRLTKSQIQVSADCSPDGGLTATLLDHQNQLLATSETMRADMNDTPLRWKNGFDPANHRGKIVRLRFELSHAGLYAFSGLRRLPAPMLSPGVRTFDEQLTVEISAPEPQTEIRYSLDGNPPTLSSPKYAGPLTIDRNLTLQAGAVFPFGDASQETRAIGPLVTAAFKRRQKATADPHAPSKPLVVAARFDRDVEGWKGLDQVEHHADGGVAGGFVRVTREQHQPYLFADATTGGGAWTGDWPQRFGGSGVRIAFQQRASSPHPRSLVEIFAGDIAQWSYFGPPATAEWSPVAVTIRHDWNDAEAEAAGWRRSPQGFSWQETIHHVGKLIIAPHVLPPHLSFDIDDVSLTTYEP